MTAQRDNAGAAVQSIREKALQEVDKAGLLAAKKIAEAGDRAQALLEDLHTTGMIYGDLSEEASHIEGVRDGRPGP